MSQEEIPRLLSYGIPIDNVTDFNEATGRVTFLDGTWRTVCQVWCRCMGYHRPVSDFNIGKKQEFKERVPFKTDKVLNQDELDK